MSRPNRRPGSTQFRAQGERPSRSKKRCRSRATTTSWVSFAARGCSISRQRSSRASRRRAWSSSATSRTAWRITVLDYRLHSRGGIGRRMEWMGSYGAMACCASTRQLICEGLGWPGCGIIRIQHSRRSAKGFRRSLLRTRVGLYKPNCAGTDERWVWCY